MRKLRITLYTDLHPAINAHLDNGAIVILKKCSGGIYYFDTDHMEDNIMNIHVAAYTFMNTVESNKTYLQKREIKVAGKSIILQK